MSRILVPLLCSLVGLIVCISAVSAVEVKGYIVPNAVLADLTELGPRTRVVLNGGAEIAYVEEDGAFSFKNVPDGRHLLEVVTGSYHFDKIRLDVSGASVVPSVTVPGTSWATVGHLLPYPLELSPRYRYDFFVPREGFNIFSLLSNPMLLMSLGTLVMVFVMPKLAQALPEEEPQQQQQTARAREEVPQIQMPDISQSLANWFAPQQGGRK
ncbi:hypothetical protein HK104_010216 [Borealophlyctis nickersoniae]|nr:hypothetical protein HK104_010216 [Borealophlyctis nickersoniae]